MTSLNTAAWETMRLGAVRKCFCGYGGFRFSVRVIYGAAVFIKAVF